MNRFVELTSITGVTFYINTAAISCFRERHLNGSYYTEITMLTNDTITVRERYSEVKEMIDGGE